MLPHERAPLRRQEPPVGRGGGEVEAPAQLGGPPGHGVGGHGGAKVLSLLTSSTVNLKQVATGSGSCFRPLGESSNTGTTVSLRQMSEGALAAAGGVCGSTTLTTNADGGEDSNVGDVQVRTYRMVFKIRPILVNCW